MRTLLLLLMLISLVTHAEVYKWVENGEVHYSDNPIHKGKKKKVTLPEISDYKSTPVRSVPLPRLTEEQDKKERYALSLVSPSQDQTFGDNTGNVAIEFKSDPAIASHAGHRIELRIGNKVFKLTSLSSVIQNVDRGTHQLVARVITSDGKVLSNEVKVSFHVKRRSVLIKKNLKTHKLLAPHAK